MLDQYVNKKGNPFKELWQEYLEALTRYERNGDKLSQKRKEATKFKLRLACKMHILHNIGKFQPVPLPEKPEIKVTSGSDLPDEYYEWALRYQRAVKENLTNKAIIKETIEFFKENKDKIAGFSKIEDLLNQAELVLDLFPEFKEKDRAKDHFIKNADEYEVIISTKDEI